MRPDLAERIRRSWFEVETSDRSFADAFYTRLFAIAPETRALFGSDMETQQTKLADTMAIVVSSIDDPAHLARRVQQLGRRHAAYGVRDEHYLVAEQALLAALADCLGTWPDDATAEAWTSTYRALADAMMAASASELPTPG